MNLELLNEKLNPDAIKKRKQGNFELSYIEGHHAIREANRIFGFDGWHRETLDVHEVQSEQKENSYKDLLWYVSYTARCQVRVGDITRQGVGFGQGQDKDLGRAHESAIKEAETDAMKRALMTFGDPFGLALYDKDQTHVAKAPTEPANGKKPTDPFIEAAGKFIKEIGLSSADFAKFKAACSLVSLDWVKTALLAKEDGVKTLDGLMKRTEKELVNA